MKKKKIKIEEMKEKIREAIKNNRIEMAFQDKIQSLPVDFVNDFFKKILDLNYSECLITDESSLYDFSEEPIFYKNKIKEVYGLNIKYNKRLLIFEIINQIKKKYKFGD